MRDHRRSHAARAGQRYGARGGLTTTFEYDWLRRVRTVQGPGSTQLIETTYDNTAGAWVKTERGTVWTQTWLDGFGRPVETVQSSGVRQRTGYDAEGRVTYQGQPYTPGAPAGYLDRGTSYTYDVLGRVLRETYADGEYMERTYALGPGGVPTMTLREPWDGATVRLTSHTYGPFGLAQLTDPASHTWAYGYDHWGRLTSIAGPVGSPASAVRTWTYDADTLASETSPEAGTITYDDYYPNGQLQQRQHDRQRLVDLDLPAGQPPEQRELRRDDRGVRRRGGGAGEEGGGTDGVLLTEWTNTGPSTATARDYLFVGSRMLGVVTRTDLAPK